MSEYELRPNEQLYTLVAIVRKRRLNELVSICKDLSEPILTIDLPKVLIHAKTLNEAKAIRNVLRDNKFLIIASYISHEKDGVLVISNEEF